MTNEHTFPNRLRRSVCAVSLALLTAFAGSALAQSNSTTERALPAPAPFIDDIFGDDVTGGFWNATGPAPIENAQVENIFPNDRVVGAIQTVVADPSNPAHLIVGAVNGGIWETFEADGVDPRWFELTDSQDSLSIGALAIDPAAPFRIVAGIGRYSSFGDEFGGDLIGVLLSETGGFNWVVRDGGGVLTGKNISGIAIRGSVILVSVDDADGFDFDREDTGIFRSTDSGMTFTRISDGDGSATGLPGCVAYDLVGDPNVRDRFYTACVGSDRVGGQDGIYRSDDAGQSWQNVGDAAVDAVFDGSFGINKVEFAIGQQNNVFVGVIKGQQLAGILRSGDGGGSWSALDVPETIEDGGVAIGIHPGFQGGIHFSIAADPVAPNIVYVGGDRQPFFSEGNGGNTLFPNSVGATDFTGRLFRGDASQPAGAQWTPLTHDFTGNGSSPHADSREMVFTADGNLVETDDGGIYLRTNPRGNDGDWFSINGDLQVNEMHSAGYDEAFGVGVGGAQDVGSFVQTDPTSPIWFSLLFADGGDVAIDSTTVPGRSVRYNSWQNLQNFIRSEWSAANFVEIIENPSRSLPTGQFLFPQFVTPVVLSEGDQRRLLIGASNGLFESFDRGDTLQNIAPEVRVDGALGPLAYGISGNPDAIYAGDLGEVFVRLEAGQPVAKSESFPNPRFGNNVTGVTMDRSDATHAFATVARGQIYRTTDGGTSWTEITGNLPTLTTSTPRSIAYVETEFFGDGIAVGTGQGVFMAVEASGFSTWKRLGAFLPNAPVFELDYDPNDDILWAGTLGRGAFRLDFVSFAVIFF